MVSWFPIFLASAFRSWTITPHLCSPVHHPFHCCCSCFYTSSSCMPCLPFLSAVSTHSPHAMSYQCQLYGVPKRRPCCTLPMMSVALLVRPLLLQVSSLVASSAFYFTLRVLLYTNSSIRTSSLRPALPAPAPCYVTCFVLCSTPSSVPSLVVLIEYDFIVQFTPSAFVISKVYLNICL
jgi:hypothetical protein